MKLAKAPKAYNPLAGRPKSNVHLFKAFDQQVAVISEAQWTNLRRWLSEMAGQFQQAHETQRAVEKQTETLFSLREIYHQPLGSDRMIPHIHGLRFFEDGGKTTLYISTLHEDEVLFDSPELKVVNLEGLPQAGSPTPELSTFGSWTKSRLVDLKTFTTVRKVSGNAVVNIGKKSFVFSGWTVDHPGVLKVRPLGRPAWFPFQPSLPIDKKTHISHVVGGESDAYVLLQSSEQRPYARLLRFDGKKFFEIDLGNFPTRNGRIMEMVREGEDLFLLNWDGEHGELEMAIHRFRKGSLVETIPLDRNYNARFWRDPEGRLAVIRIGVDFVERRHLNDPSPAPLRISILGSAIDAFHRENFQLVGMIRYRDTDAAVIYRNHTNEPQRLHIYTMDSGEELASLALPDVSARKIAVHQTKNGKLYLFVDGINPMTSVYSLLNRVTHSKRD